MKRRSFTIKANDFEVRNEDGTKKIRGYAALFDSKSVPIWRGYREIIKRGAFKKTIKDGDIRALVNHDTNMVLGRSTAGTLSLEEDEKGLYVEIIPPETTFANDLLVSIERGDVNQFSFGFDIIKDTEIETDKEILHELREVKLYEISIVPFPAYEDTKAEFRNLEAVNKCYRDDETFTDTELEELKDLQKRLLDILKPEVADDTSVETEEPSIDTQKLFEELEQRKSFYI